jgi:glutamate-1-semialdehyde 2,1-aminomutase
MTCLGKIVGGGVPCGVFGGRRELMDLLAPLGPVYQAGTLSGNPLAMAAGRATLEYLYKHSDKIYPHLDKLAGALVDGVLVAAKEAGVTVTANRVGSMFTWFFTGDAVTDFATAARSDTEQFARFHQSMLEGGVWLPPSQYEAAFLSTAHSDHDVALTLEVAVGAMRGLAAK